MLAGGHGRRRGFAIAAIALTLVVVAPELAPVAGAATGARSEARHALAAKKPVSAKEKAAIARYLRLHPNALKKTGAAKTGTTIATGTAKTATTKKKGKGTAAYRRAVAKRLKAERLAAARRKGGTGGTLAARTAAARARARAAAKEKAPPLSLPFIAFLALAPFVLMGVYLLGLDYLRRRPPRKRRASLVITRVGDR